MSVMERVPVSWERGEVIGVLRSLSGLGSGRGRGGDRALRGEKSGVLAPLEELGWGSLREAKSKK